jgi:hypothetical protein
VPLPTYFICGDEAARGPTPVDAIKARLNLNPETLKY